MALPIQPVVQPWKGLLDTSVPFFSAVAPDALREYWAGLYQYALALCTQPYPVTSVHFNPDDGESGQWNFFQVLAPGTHSLRGRFSRCVDLSQSGDPGPTSVWTGTAPLAADEIQVEPPFGAGANEYPPHEGAVGLSETGENYNEDTPSAGDDRLLEVPTALDPQIETFIVEKAIGFGGVANQVGDLAAI